VYATGPVSESTQHTDEALPGIDRRRYQRGALRRERRRWILRLREDVAPTADTPAHRREKRVVVGAVVDLPTRALARRAADAMLSNFNPTRVRSAEGMTVAGFAQIYLTDVVAMMKRASARSTRSLVLHHIVPALGHYRLEQITGRVPQQFVAKIHAKGLARKSLINILVALGRMMDLATDQGYPCVRFGKHTVKLPPDEVEHTERCFTPEEVQRIIVAADMPWRLMYSICGAMGLRVGEVLGLAWPHVVFPEGVLRLRQSVVLGRIQTLKSKISKADLPIPGHIRELLAEYHLVWRPNPANLLFATARGTPLWADSVRRYQFGPLLHRLGLPHGGFHAFRHGVATNLFAAGVKAPTVQSMMRHSDIKTTLGYTNVVLEDQRAAGEAATSAIAPADPWADQVQRSLDLEKC
jgi:integrase